MTKKEEKTLNLNFAEAENHDEKSVRLFRNYAKRRFLIGYVPERTKEWVYQNKLYNIREDSKECKGGVDKDDPKTYAVDYIVLYENRYNNRYQIYPVTTCQYKSLEEIKAMKDPEPHSDYMVYSLGEEVTFERISLWWLLKQENEHRKGTPVFLTGKDIYGSYRKFHTKKVGLVDADLLCNGTRHPNLALLKIAGYLWDNDVPFELIIDEDADTTQYAHIYMSRVFTFTEEPKFYTKASASERKKFHIGGTGYYANEKSVSKFRALREEDMNRLSDDPYLNTLTCKHSGKHGINMATQMPYYHLYDEFVQNQIDAGVKRDKYKDYLDYSIGFLTRKCYRHCPFCVNKLEDGVVPYSELDWFYDKTRPYVYFWDDNFLAAPYNVWKPRLQYLIDNKISFQFRQGLDERQLAESPYGEEMAEMLGKSRYHGDFIYAFDNWKDRPIIERALKIWKRHCPKKGTKFYLFCGFMQKPDGFDKFYKDIWELFQRIKVLMQYGCVGYVMRHEDYHKAPLENIYVQIARWVNQQQFYKKMSFWEYSYRNQTFWEQGAGFAVPQEIKPFDEFENDYNTGYYEREDARGKIRKISRPLQTVLDMLEMFPQHREELLEMFNYKLENLKDPRLWEE